jgi:hypothetical protein
MLHKAIAELAKTSWIKTILTTNFDKANGERTPSPPLSAFDRGATALDDEVRPPSLLRSVIAWR